MKTEGETLILCLGVTGSCLGVVWIACCGALLFEGQAKFVRSTTLGVTGSSVSDSDSELESSESELNFRTIFVVRLLTYL